MRAGELTPRECKAQIHESSRAFTVRYAAAVQLAKQLANETGVVTLRRLASSQESWDAARRASEMQVALSGHGRVLNDESDAAPVRGC